ncbi:nucleoside hydrolase [Marmoricola endophyticus]|uniref:Nucleoside hydrolase n=1 Tax=Marmoricola endophyticus TaxID=2040280 RepID=A0A917F756_9ACTN|nr:nucleoside hydrolase [Marmoricola endophyticus]GGF54008.1 nucleoside hydrolase [Marmoricola endophyticus]
MSTESVPAVPVVLDVDTGIDDALAILYASHEPRLDLRAVSAVVGNVPVEQAAANSLAVLAAEARVDVPVVRGAGRTLAGSGARVGPTNHGTDGLGGVPVTPAQRPAEASAPVEVLASAGPASLVACAPLTNVAAMLGHPHVERLVMVGGELVVEGEPEFNVGHDPRATAAALAREVPTTIYAIDVFETVAVPAPLVEALRGARAPSACLAGELLAVRRAHLLGDAGAVVLLAHPELFTVEPVRMGMVGDRLVPSADGREVDVVVAADGPAVVEAFVAAVRSDP